MARISIVYFTAILTIISIANAETLVKDPSIRNEFDDEVNKTMEIDTGEPRNNITSLNKTMEQSNPIANTSDIDKLIDLIDNNSTEFTTLPSTILEPSFTTTPTTTTTSAPNEFDYYPYRCKNGTEMFSNCSNSCPASCEEPTRKACRNYCWKGCECAPGHVKDHRWKCVPIEECPKCGDNEHYRNCGSNCEATCETFQNMPVFCNQRASCKRGCFCNYGFVRDEAKNGTCVPIDQCPQKCPENEYWEPSGEPCLRTLDNPRPSCLFEKSKPSCVCNTGFRRNTKTNVCEPVSKLFVQKHECLGNETFSFCGSDCATNCFDESKRHMCPTLCKRGCFCNDGYRRDNGGSCVLPEDCKNFSQNHFTPIFRV